METTKQDMVNDRYHALVEKMVDRPDVMYGETNKGFGSSALKVHGKIFAMVVGGKFTVKLPRQRVDALVASGDGTRMDTGSGHPMKEWLCIAAESPLDWTILAEEALKFVGK